MAQAPPTANRIAPVVRPLLILGVATGLPAWGASPGEAAAWGSAGAVLVAAVAVAVFLFTSRRHSRESLQSVLGLVDRTPSAILLHRDGLVLHANPAFLVMLGLKPEARCEGRALEEFFAPSERETSAARLSENFSGSGISGPLESRCLRLGETFPVQLRTATVDLPDGPADLLSIEDLTEREEALAAIGEAKRAYQGLFENTHNAILVIEPDSERIVEANNQACEMYGFSRATLVGMSLEELSTDVTTGKGRIRETLEAGFLRGFEAVHRRRDGQLIPLEVNASVVEYRGRKAILSILKDITKRRSAEDALRKNEENHRLLVENQTDLVATMDRAGRLLFASPSFCRQFGLDPGRVTGAAMASFLFEEDRADLARVLMSLGAPPHSSQMEHRLVTEGGIRWYSCSCKGVLDASGNLETVIISGRDVTERRAVEEALRESEQRFRALTESTSAAILIYRNEEVIYANPAAERVTGYTGAELGKLPLPHLLHPDHRDLLMRRALARQRGEPVLGQYEVPVLRKDGRVRWLLISLAPVPYQGVPSGVVTAFDVTERREADERQRRSALEMESIFNALPDLYFRMDSEGRILDFRAGRREDLYVAPDQFLGRRMVDVLPPSVASEFDGALGRVFSSREPASLEYTLPMPDGDRHFEARMVPLFDDQVVAVVRNVTDRNMAISDLKTSEQTFRSLVASAPLGFHLYSLEEGGRLVLTGANPAADLILGVDHRQFIGKTIEEAFPGLASTEIPARYREICERGIPWHTEQFTYADQRITGAFEVHVFQTAPRCIGVMFSDVTERSRLADAVKGWQTRFELVTAASGQVVYDYSLPSGSILWSGSIEEVLGYSAEEMGDISRWGELIHPEDRPEAFRLLEEAERACSLYDTEYRFQKAGGNYIIMHDRGLFVPGEGGTALRMIGMMTDVTAQKESEQALRHSEEEFRRTFDLSPVGAIMVSSEGRFTRCNRTFCHLLGYSEGELKGRSFLDVTHPEDLHIGKKEIPALLSGEIESARLQKRYIRKDGAEIVAEITVRLVPAVSGTPPYFLTIVQDITDKEKTEAALRESEERYRILMENANDAVFVADADTGLLVDANRRALELVGRSIGEVQGMHQTELHPAEERERYSGIFKNHIMDGRGLGMEVFVIHKDGHRVPVEISASLVEVGGRNLVHGLFRDMTERHRAEEALRESETRLRMIYDNVGEIIYYNALEGDPPQMVPRFANRQVKAILGYTPEEFLGNLKLWIEACHPEDWPRVQASFPALLSSKAPFTLNYRFRHRETGEYHWIEDTAVPDLDAEGRPRGFFGVARDVTARRVAEEQLKVRNRHLLALAASAQAMGSYQDVAAATRAICQASLEAFGASMAWVGLVVPHSTEVTPIASAGRDDGYTDQVRVRWDLSPRAMGPVGRAIKARCTQVMRVGDEDFAPWRDEATKRGFQSVCALPLLNGDEVRGAIAIYSDDPSAFGPEAFDILDIFARQSAMVLVNAGLYEEAKKTIHELWAAQEEARKKP